MGDSSLATVNSRWTAITRGAVLHKLGLNYVHERVMRRHYGIVTFVPYDKARHPKKLRFKGMDGQWKCNNVMNWFAAKVRRSQILISSRVIELWIVAG